MRIAIIEDEPAHSELLASYLQAWSRETSVPVNILSFTAAKDFLFIWEETNNFDILFVDIQMEHMNGMELARRIRETDREIALVFTTGDEGYLEEGYEVEAMYYLLKPLSREKISRCMEKLSLRRHMEHWVLVHGKEEALRLFVGRITYVEARGHGCMVETWSKLGETSRTEIMESISEMAETLSPYGFVRCHRSYLCRVDSIYRIGKTELLLENGSMVPVSRRMYKEVSRAFIRHFRNVGRGKPLIDGKNFAEDMDGQAEEMEE